MVNPMHRAAYAEFLRMLVAARQDSGMTQTEVASQRSEERRVGKECCR